ncbi:MAG TPA: hypothetical protein VFK26_10185 [Gemmatimonadaceae bacterium]|jgi:hypothetical protein|nr:hypothetical protein [Gemmatimonadaceae bacterium]
MKSFSLALAITSLYLASAALPCRGQTAMQVTPAPNPLQAITQALSGKWQLDVRFEAVPAAGNKVVAGPGEESWSAGPGGITLVEQEHIPSPFGDTFLMGVIWWNSTSGHLGGVECNSYSPGTCDLKGGLNDITISWDGKKFQIDELETHNGQHTVWHEYWTDITPDSFTQMGDVTQPDGTTTHFMTIHGKRVQQLKSIAAR